MMCVQRATAAAVGVLGLVAAPAAWAANCTTPVSISGFTTTTYQGSGAAGSYDVFDATALGQTVTFTVTQNKKGTCTINVGVTAGLNSSGSYNPRKLASGANRLNYNVYRDSSKGTVLQDTPLTAANLITVNFANSTTATGTYFFDVPIQQIAKPGSYTDTVTFRLYNSGSSTVLASATPIHTATVVSQAELSLVATNGAFSRTSTTISNNFGTLAPGKAFSFDTLGRGNNGYDLKMQSTNQQTMKIQNVVGDTSSVPYTISVGGTNVDLTGSSAVTVATVGVGTTSPLAGTRYPVAITIGSFNPATPTSGTYQDSITVTIISK